MARKPTDPLKKYKEMRDFAQTPEPEGKVGRRKGRSFVVQKHDATRLHYDIRLELEGVLKSWAVTKGPSLDPADKRLAVRTEDHPLDYGDFEGVIPKGYGAGTVMLWDRGQWAPVEDPHEGLAQGKLKFVLSGERLKGGFTLVRMRAKEKEKRENWLLIKERDEFADESVDPRDTYTVSVKTGRDMDAIAADKPPKKKPNKKKARTNPGKLPKFVKPQLATLVDEPPAGDRWLHEIKYDGYRLIAAVAGERVKLWTRNEKDWTAKFPEIAEGLSALDLDSALIDGEVVALDDDGRSDFSALQKSLKSGDGHLVFYAFDLLARDGKDLKSRALKERKAALQALLADAEEPIRYSDHIAGDGDSVIAQACRLGLEGVLSKRADSKYRTGRRTKTWLKSKCTGRGEFVIGGYRKSDKAGRPFASLLLGEYVDGKLVYRGRVGTGFDEDTLAALHEKMKRLERKTSPFTDEPAEARDRAAWLKPALVAEIAYTEMTGAGALRHPAYLGLRKDKSVSDLKRNASQAGANDMLEGVRLTSPDKVLFPDQNLTKRELADYYLEMAEPLLAHLAGRPLSLVRCPEGRTSECFFHKHHNTSTPGAIKTVEITEKGGKKAPYLLIDDRAGLVAAAQIGALELHVWGSRADKIERPERIVFDLDPGEGVPFDELKDAARELRDVLEAAGLASFALLTGGKGIHVIVPIARRHGWDEIKGFAKGLATALANERPERYLAKASKAERKGRIFIDWLRNQRGATAIAPFSPRARPSAPVATPVGWDELSRIEAASKYTVKTIGRRLSQLGGDPWAGYFDLRQSIAKTVLEDFAA